MKRPLAVAALFLACRTPKPEPPSAEELHALPRILTQVVDDLADVEEAGGIEMRAMKRAVALAARMEEPDLRGRSRPDWTRSGLLAEPESYRGEIIFARGLVVQLIPVGGGGGGGRARST